MFESWMLLFIWYTVADMNFKIFVEAAIQGPIIMSMTFAWLWHRNKNIFLCLNPECFCLFDTLLLTWISRFLWKQTSCWCFMRGWRHQNKEIFVYLNVDCLFLFDKLLLTWISVFAEATMSSISLQSYGCLLSSE